jgi:hypothetical protein
MIQIVAIGVAQLLVLFLSLVFPVVIFFIGYYFGKKSGYLKRIKEEEFKK